MGDGDGGWWDGQETDERMGDDVWVGGKRGGAMRGWVGGEGMCGWVNDG